MTDGGTVNYESGLSFDILKILTRKGHRIQPGSGGFGGYQAIMYDAKNKVFYGASESRKDGHAAGF